MEKVAIYCRLSEEDRGKHSTEDDSMSIQNQKAMLCRYAAEQGWCVYDIYSDDDYAGSDRNRPEFKRLLSDAKERRFDIVLCKTQSRFTRELELVETYIHGLFPLWGIRFISIVDHADTANKGNKKSRQINGLVNEWYLEDMSESIRSALTSRRQNGFHIGSFALYGYQKDPEQKGHLIIDEEAAEIVREVFTLYANGHGKTAIARILNQQGVPNPTEYKRLKGLRYHQPTCKAGTLWSYCSVSEMLKNEIYIGNMVQGRYGSVSYKTKQNKPRPKNLWYRLERTHAPIIDPELWERVQTRLSEHTRPLQSGSIGVFAGKALCANCGYTMRSSKSRGKHYLTCPTRRKAKDACNGAFISVERLEQLILSQLNVFSDSLPDFKELEQTVAQLHTPKDKKTQLEQMLNTCQRQIQQLTAALGALYLDRARGNLPEDTFCVLSHKFTCEQDRWKKQAQQTRQTLSDFKPTATSENYSRQESIYQYTHPKHLTREMTDLFIHHLVIGKRKKGEKDPPVEIHWNF